MTIQDLAGQTSLRWPTAFSQPYDNGDLRSDQTINASGEFDGWVIRIPARLDGKSLNQLAIRLASYTSGDFILALRDVDLTDGTPGALSTPDGGGGGSAVTFTPAAGWNIQTLDEAYTVSAGDLLWGGIEFDTTGSCVVGSMRHNQWQGNVGSAFPYVCYNISAGDVLNYGAAEERPHISFGFSDGTWYSPIPPVKAFTLDTVHSTTDPQEIGIKFQVPFPCRFGGLLAKIGLTSLADVKVILGSSSYAPGDTGATVLSEITLDKDVSAVNANVQGYTLESDEEVDLAANTDYYCVVRATTTTNVEVCGMTFETAALMQSIVGSNWVWVEESGGSWSETSTKSPEFSLLLRGFDDAAGGGSTTNYIKKRRRVR